LFIYFTFVLASIQARTEVNKQGYGLDRKRTWKRGNSQFLDNKLAKSRKFRSLRSDHKMTKTI